MAQTPSICNHPKGLISWTCCFLMLDKLLQSVELVLFHSDYHLLTDLNKTSLRNRCRFRSVKYDQCSTGVDYYTFYHSLCMDYPSSFSLSDNEMKSEKNPMKFLRLHGRPSHFEVIL